MISPNSLEEWGEPETGQLRGTFGRLLPSMEWRWWVIKLARRAPLRIWIILPTTPTVFPLRRAKFLL
jgi:hypothetical protein